MRIQVVFLVTFLISCSLTEHQNNGIQTNNANPPNETNDTLNSSKKEISNECASINKNDENKVIKNIIIDIFKQNCKIDEDALKPLLLDTCDFKETNAVINLRISCLAAKATAIKLCTNSSSVNISTINSLIGEALNITKFCSVQRNLSFSSDDRDVNEFFKLLQKSRNCLLICGSLDDKTYPICSFIDSYYKNQTKVVELGPVEKPKESVKFKPDSSLVQSNTNENSSKVSKTTNVSSAKINEKEEQGDLGKQEMEPANEENVEESDMHQNLDIKSKTPNADGGDSPDKIPDTLTQVQSHDVEISNKFSGNFDGFVESESSHFFTYFLCLSGICILFYVAVCNKKKILALVIEGRRTSVKRRPNSAVYSKLDCNLEEALLSGPSTSSSNTILY